jgi:hydroxyacylglutathione hydrolase
LRAFKDNYVWTLRNARCAAVVDPGEAQPVLEYLAAEKLQLIAILATHHHQDHVGGIEELLRTNKVPVYGPRGEPIATLTQAVGGGDKVSLEQLGVSFEVPDIPGHTRTRRLLRGKHAVLWRHAVRAAAPRV